MKLIDTYTKKQIRRLNIECVIYWVILIAVILLTASCRKEARPVITGGTYRVKPNIFNTGVWQPSDTLYAKSIYFNQAAGLNYCNCIGPGSGRLTAIGRVVDTSAVSVNWQIPTDDLR